MKPSEVAKLPTSAYRRPVEIEGFLVVSGPHTHILDENPYDDFPSPQLGVLLNPKAIDPLIKDAGKIQLGGSMVRFTGKIALQGTITHTGFSMLPVYVPFVYKFSFEAKNFERRAYHVCDPYVRVVLSADNEFGTAQLKKLKDVAAPEEPIMSFKQKLDSTSDIVLAKYVNDGALAELVDVLEDIDASYIIEPCEVGPFGSVVRPDWEIS